MAPTSGQVPRVDPRQPPPRAYTPAHLAQKILTSRSALEGERKQVTVLFVDVVGSTSLAEGFDPEEMHALMGRAIQLMVDEVHRCEGTVNQFLGDGIMALFGAPIAHEDHARRAVQAALAIQQALAPLDRELRRKRNLGLRVRQGLNTGLVVVGSIGTDLRMDYTAVGDTTNVAARLQHHAEPGSILLSEHTRRLVAGYFTLRSLGEISVKGKADPVAAWEVISAQPARARIDIEADRGLTPFVGREKELDTLLECFAKATAGSGQVALLVREPGIGKSRLLLELRRRLGDRAHWSEGRALSFGRNIPFHPLVDMLRRLHGIDPSDSEVQVIDKLERGVLRLGAELATTLPFLRHLLSVDPGDAKVAAMDPQLRRGELFDALRRVLLRAAELKPQVLVYEDLHWVDPATEQHLRFIIDSLPNARVLLLLTFRPEYTYALGQRSYQTWVQLNPLSGEEGAQMADALIASRSISAQLRALILEKAEGNPFFVEEVVKSLEETAAVHLGDKSSASIDPDSMVVPDTIQDVIGARIDRLGDELKRVLQLASVIGREFARNLILRLTEAPERADALLQQLKSLELIYEKNLYPEPVYTFKHALTQEVAYASLLLKRRKELHRAIGLAIEELYAERLADHYELLAHHLVLGEQWDRALDYLLKAGQKAAQANANREALALYDQALEVAQHSQEPARARILADIQESRANACALLSDFALAHEALQGVLEFARRTGDRAREGTILGQMGLISVWHHRFAIAAEESSQTLVIAAETRDERLETSGLFNLGWLEMVLGRVEEAASKFARVQSLGHATGDAFHETQSVALLALIARWSGEYRQSAQLAAQARLLARSHQTPIPAMSSTWHCMLVATEVGDYERSLGMLAELEGLAKKIGNEFWYYRQLNSAGWLYLNIGDLDAALDRNQRASVESLHRPDAELTANADLNLADTYLARGDVAAAEEVLERVLRLSKNPGTSDWMRWRYSQHLFASLAELWLARGDAAKAGEFASQCLTLARKHGSKKYMATSLRLLGETAFARTAFDEVKQPLTQALEIGEQIGGPTQIWKAHAALGRLHAELRRPEQAMESYRAALQVLEDLKARTQDPSLRLAFERSPYLAYIRDLIAATPGH